MALAAAGVTAVALLGAGPAAPAQGDVVAIPFAKPAQARVSAVRVCSSESFGQNGCLRDERVLPLLTRAVGCSARVDLRRAGRVVARLTYEGAVAYTLSRRVARGSYTVSMGAALPGVDVPGGAYRCEFVAGRARGVVNFRSAGPLDPLLAPSVCTSDRLPRPEQMPCEADESAAPLQAPRSVTCSAAYARQHGKRFGIEMLAREGETWTSVFRYDELVPNPLASGFAAIHLTSGQPLPAGDYLCRFFLDEQLVVEKPFSIATPVL